MYEREIKELESKMNLNPIFRANVLEAYQAAVEADPKREVYEHKLWGWFLTLVDAESTNKINEVCEFLKSYKAQDPVENLGTLYTDGDRALFAGADGSGFSGYHGEINAVYEIEPTNDFYREAPGSARVFARELSQLPRVGAI